MIETHTLYRPGFAAIAAVLALSSTAAMAQVALPDVGAGSPVAAPAAPPAQAPVQTVQAVSATPTLPDIAVQDAPAKATPSRVMASPRQRADVAPVRATARVAPKVTPVATSNMASEANSAPVTPAPRAATGPKVKPIVSLNENSAPKAAPAAPRAEAQASQGMGIEAWTLLGGGLLVVAAGTALAFGRRGKRRDQAVDTVSYETTIIPEAPAFRETALRTSEPLVVAPVAREEPRRTSSPAAAPVSARQNIGDGVGEDRTALLEAMIAEEPSEANPFHSRRNRLRRADFLLRTGQVADSDVVTAPRTQQEPSIVSDRWSESRFGTRQNARVSWKPSRTN